MQTTFVIGATHHEDPQVFDFSAPVDVARFMHEDALFVEIIQTGAFQRLNEVRFLGGIDYLIVRSPNGVPGNIRYTRWQHSLGVARLALMYSRACQISTEDTRYLVAAALFHDIGHAPLSHSLEPVFKEQFGLDHHMATRDIIEGRVPIGKTVYKALRQHQIDIDRLVSIISGEEHGFHDLFAGPINFDTIEGILRARSYAQSLPAVIAPEIIVDAAVNRRSTADQEIVDQFWISKDQVYNHLINAPVGVLADEVCKTFMRNFIAGIGPDDYYTSEEQIFKKLPGLRALLTSPNFMSEVSSYVPSTIEFTKRRFSVDQRYKFEERNDTNRYVQTRSKEILRMTPAGVQRGGLPQGRLF